MHHQELTARQRRERATHSPRTALRVHRALSWFGRAEQLVEDPDTQFVLLWIAFNAAYALDIEDGMRRSERLTFKGFLDQLIGLDDSRCIEDLVWTEFPGSIRVLLDNVYRACRKMQLLVAARDHDVHDRREPEARQGTNPCARRMQRPWPGPHALRYAALMFADGLRRIQCIE
jgi:hypothetical protein